MEQRIVRADDPACDELESSGWIVVSRSWGANLDPHDPQVAGRVRAALTAQRASGITVRELSTHDAAQVAAVEAANHADYPQTPATRHAPVTVPVFRALLDGGARAWGAELEGNLIGVAVASPKAAGWWDITFASVLAEHRGLGIGQLLAATIISDVTEHGADRISTGGAASNDASRGAALALGAHLEPEWRTYAPAPG
jgi:ribosomal protein S18 acetylase RimI-like enzyme